MNDRQQQPQAPSPAASDAECAAPQASSQETTDTARTLTVLIVDDERVIADTLAFILNHSGFEARAAYSGHDGLALAADHCPDILISDVSMPGLSGVETAMRMREMCPAMRIILLSGLPPESEGRDRQPWDGFELWRKPIHPHELVRRLRAGASHA